MKKYKSNIGSISWENKIGNLNRKEKLNYFSMIVKAQLKEQLEKVGITLGFKQYQKVHFDDIKFPDSSFAKKAVEKSLDTYNGNLLNHCYRTFYWAAGIAKIKNVKYDLEILFVASILHDIGLADSHNHICNKNCFAVYGANEVYQLALDHQIEFQKANQLYNAIGMHLNPIVKKELYGAEAFLLSKGAAMDVIGTDYFKFSHFYIKDVQSFHPRDGFKKEIIATMTDFKHLKDSRADLLLRWGFAKLADTNPLDKHFYNNVSKDEIQRFNRLL